MATKCQERWQLGKSLPQCLSHILENEISSDVAFVVSSEDPSKAPTRIAAHKFMMKARSHVFEAMFSGDYKESSNDVNIVDSEPQSFMEMLRYIYSDEVQLTSDNVFPILQLSRKYMLEGLTDICMEYIDEQLSEKSVCGIMTKSITFKEEDVSSKCLCLVEEKTAKVVASSGFLDLSQEALLTILKSDRLQYDAEGDVLEACLKWAHTNKGDQSDRDVLGDCVYQIRYLQLTGEQFVEQLGESLVLSAEERDLFLCYLFTRGQQYLKKTGQRGFNTEPRILELSRSGSVPILDMYFIHNEEQIKISATTPVIIRGVSVYSGPKGFSHNVDVKITDKSSGTQLGEIQSTFTSVKQGIIPVWFTEGIKLDPDTEYVIHATPPPGQPECIIDYTDSHMSGAAENIIKTSQIKWAASVDMDCILFDQTNHISSIMDIFRQLHFVLQYESCQTYTDKQHG